MPETWRYRGQTMDREQLTFLREFIAAHPDSSRWKLSRQLCEALGWKQANGALRDVVCRGWLLLLERAWRDRLAGGPPPHPRTAPERALTTATGAHRHHATDPSAEHAVPPRDAAGAAHGRRTAV